MSQTGFKISIMILLIIFQLNLTLNKSLNNRFETRIKERFAAESNSSTPYQIKYWDAKVDNFDYNNKDTFKQRILYSDVHYKDGGPIFFYPGNEGPITQIWPTVNYMTDYLAKYYGALIIFVEHRYFGESLLYGKPFSFDPSQNRYLSSEQALFDYARYLQEFKQENPNYLNAKVIAFGTSYGGMLVAWFRMKYPHVIDGGVANSAPILLFQGPRNVEYKFFEYTTKAYLRYSEDAPNFIRFIFDLLDEFKSNLTTERVSLLAETLTSVCSPIQNVTDIINFQNQLESVLESYAQFNFPPALPLKSFTAFIDNLVSNLNWDEKSVLVAFNQILNQTNIFSQTTCLDFSPVPILNQPTSPWQYMACTEMIFPIASNGVTDMFNFNPWNNTLNTEECIQYWNADVRPNQEFNNYGGRYYLEDFKTSSNIFYSNGLFDPWNSGCPQQAPNDKIQVAFSKSAHGEALWVLEGQDASVLEVRSQINQTVGQWLNN